MADLDELRRLRRARDRMDRELARPLDLAVIAPTALMAQAHFSRRCREAYGEAPCAYLMTRRIERAAALLRTGDVSVTDACMRVGCSSLGSFSASFTKLMGETPSAYRAREHEALDGMPGCLAMVLTRPRKGDPSSRFREARRAMPALASSA
ncbi:helix-turn-helix transcriptional regulator [Agrococcus sp. Marseille-Q4369]|uniref:helix-turn-helix transcriptional regulator n=1 Tax=Agrococcus sp. Marseille-Q4369 TaxID=2810513 RepID=UPI001B8C0871|nr:helix-turn-helix transcriptional regulator [Agrococcus sp. Marseille-Q4369]QUW20097.1 helix-turn-helix transcriptional regulator [Agrococcus sp. Marseille-Q4369]